MKYRTFPHGIHPPENKSHTEAKALEIMPPPEKVSISLLQHFGNPAKPLVKKGEEVMLGQKIGESSSFFSANIHSSVSGKVLSVDGAHHPLGKPMLAVTIANDGEDREAPEIRGSAEPFDLKPDAICQIVKEAGIVGLGGAAFPTAVKLSPPKDKPIDTVIINGCECEPMLTADYRVMLEYGEDILKGAALIQKATGAERTLIGIEDNKIEAKRAFAQGMDKSSAEVAVLKTKYPQGAEKNLIYALLGREVPRGGLPFDVGVVVQNVGTAKAIWDAVSSGKPLYERALTVAGEGVREPKNLMVRIGTPMKNVLEFCGGIDASTNVLIMGGPMMGLTQWSTEVPVVKGTSGILAWTAAEFPSEHSCIRCSRCVEHCPMQLVPTQLMKYVKYGFLSDAEKWGILDCVECGSCQYICPAAIPLVHWIRLGKNRVMELKREIKSSDA
ncbi:MAG: electron transport complex subunit RsxC [Candidatus Aminicenantes bacterium]|jgi:electron transport complex protein RnfC